MSCSEVINIAVSIISVVIALVALFQTKRQIVLSNKHKLFDRRLSCLLEFNTIYNLYAVNKSHLKDDDAFCHANALIFSWLTNCSELEEMTLAIFKPLHQKEQTILLTKYEQLKNSATEIEMIFDGNVAKKAGEFISSFADLLKAMYQQQVYISKLKDQESSSETPPCPDDYEEKCRQMAERLGIFNLCNKLEQLGDEIDRQCMIDRMENALRLTKVKNG